MSIFDGRIQEYPSVVVDSFVTRNLNARAFFLSHCHKDHMEGLESRAFADTLITGCSKGIFLYCSETTKNLISCDSSLSHLVDCVVGVPLHEPKVINLAAQGDEEGEEKIIVTLLSAGHCVGSVMFLFEGSKGNVLYTGDFRLKKDEIERLSGIHTSSGTKKIKSIYVDTTFCVPSVKELPSREQTTEAIIKLARCWVQKGPNYLIQLHCSARYGYEFIFKELALYFKTKVHISTNMYQLYSCLPDMIQHFTFDGAASQIHACTRKKYQKGAPRLHCGLRKINDKDIHVLRIKPSTMWFVMNGIYPENLTRALGGVYRVLHSMHASYSEIRELVAHLRPKYVFPTVPPALSNDILDAYKCLKDLQNKDPDSQESMTDSPADDNNCTKDAKSFNKTREEAVEKLKEARRADEELKEAVFGNLLSSSPPVKRRSKVKDQKRHGSLVKEESDRKKNTLQMSPSYDCVAVKKEIDHNMSQNGDVSKLLGNLSPPVKRKKRGSKSVKSEPEAHF